MMSIVNLSEVRKVWTARYGEKATRLMMGGAVQAAYDARYGLRGRRFARDDNQDPSQGGEEDDASGMGQVKTFLQNRLSPEDWQRLCQMMDALGGGGGQEGPSGNHYDPPDSVPDEQAKDEPAPFPGRPRPGGKMGQDARPRSYHDEFPSNAHVNINDYGRRS
jgi:hypothetical protein